MRTLLIISWIKWLFSLLFPEKAIIWKISNTRPKTTTPMKTICISRTWTKLSIKRIWSHEKSNLSQIKSPSNRLTSQIFKSKNTLISNKGVKNKILRKRNLQIPTALKPICSSKCTATSLQMIRFLTRRVFKIKVICQRMQDQNRFRICTKINICNQIFTHSNKPTPN